MLYLSHDNNNKGFVLSEVCLAFAERLYIELQYVDWYKWIHKSYQQVKI